MYTLTRQLIFFFNRTVIQQPLATRQKPLARLLRPISGLVQDPLERSLVAGHEAQHDHDDREGNARRDQAQLSSGGSKVVLH